MESSSKVFERTNVESLVNNKIGKLGLGVTSMLLARAFQ